MDKQIEENGKELYNDLSSIMSEEYEKRMLITPSYCAEKMLEKGYRKIPEGAVVLMRERYEELEKAVDSVQVAVSSFTRLETIYKIKCKELELAEEKARKETAEKIADWLDNEKGYCGLGYLVKQKFCAEEK